VLSEYVFSDGGDIITKRRNKIAPDTLQHIIYLQNWGIIAEEQEEEYIEELSRPE
jgi:hypothetical protein